MPRVRNKVEGAQRFEMRSRPRQSRSRSKVALIKAAALAQISEEGLASCTTWRIAGRAGISIGSLYQYFPNREAILKALYEDVSTDFALAMQGVMLEILDLPTDEAVPRVVSKLVTMHQRNQLILLDLVRQLPELNLEAQPLAFNNLIRSSIRTYVQHRNRSLKPREVAHKVFFLERIILGSIQQYLNEPPAGMNRREFTRNLARIVAGYIEDVSGG